MHSPHLKKASGRKASRTLTGDDPVICDIPMANAVPTRLAAIDCDVILAVISPRLSLNVKLAVVEEEEGF